MRSSRGVAVSVAAAVLLSSLSIAALNPLKAVADPDVSGGACAPGAGVTVVVDFTGDPSPANQRVEVGCATTDALQGTSMRVYDAYSTAGFTIDSEAFATTVDGVRADYEQDGRWWTLYANTDTGYASGTSGTDWADSWGGLADAPVAADQAYALTISPATGDMARPSLSVNEAKAVSAEPEDPNALLDPPAYGATANQAALLSAAWLGSEIDVATTVVDTAADYIYGLAAAGVGKDLIGQLGAKLMADGESYMGDAANPNYGRIAKVGLALHIAGLDPTKYPGAEGTRDLVQELYDAMDEDGALPGTNLFSYAYVAALLARSPQGVPSEAVTYVKSLQCTDPENDSFGLWSWGSSCGYDTDFTASALSSLAAAGLDQTDQAVANAVAAITARQNAAGDYPGWSGSNSNTNGVLGQAMWAVGASAPASAGDAWIGELQVTCELIATHEALEVADLGVIAYSASDFAKFLDTGVASVTSGTAWANAQALLSLSQRPYHLLTATGATAGLPDRECTSNAAPSLADGVAAEVAASVALGESFTVDLTSIFTDTDNDTLTFAVAIDGATATSADASYWFEPAVAGSHTLVFIANDGTADSPTYTVNLTVTESSGSPLVDIAPYGASTNRSALDAAAFLAQHLDKTISASTAYNVGYAVDYIMAFAAAGVGSGEVEFWADFIESSGITYIRAAGTSGYFDEIAKVIVALHIAGHDPTTFPVGDGTTRDLVTELQSAMTEQGTWTGSTAVDAHSWILVALARTKAGIPAAALNYLLGLQCLTEGNANYGTWGGTTACTSWTPAASQLALQALIAAGQKVGSSNFDAAVTGLTAKQLSDHGWSSSATGTTGVAANTATISAALQAGGATELAAAGNEFLTAMQIGCSELSGNEAIIQAHLGAIMSTQTNYDTALASGVPIATIVRNSTAAGVLGFAGRAIVELTAAGIGTDIPARGRCEIANNAPTLADGVDASTDYAVFVGESFSYDLSNAFADADGDPLTFTVSVDGAAAVTADQAYSFVTSAVGTHTFAFVASDFADAAPTWTVQLTVKAIPNYAAIAPTSYGASDSQSALDAAAWLAANYDPATLSLTSTNVLNAVNALLGLASVGTGGDLIDDLADFIWNSGETFIGAKGASGTADEVARVVIALQVAGLDPTAYPVSEGVTRNLVAELVLGMNLQGTWNGLSNITEHAWVVVALGRTVGGVPPEALSYLSARQCLDEASEHFGTWASTSSGAACSAYAPDSAGMGLQALLAAGLTKTDARISAALTGLANKSLSDGGWGANANQVVSAVANTATATSALWGADAAAVAASGASFLASMQFGCDVISYSDLVTDAERGAVASNASYYNNILTRGMGAVSSHLTTTVTATANALLALGQHSLVELTAIGASAAVITREVCPEPVNRAPQLASGVAAEAVASTMATEPYEVDLATIFTDPDGDELSFTVAVDGAAAVAVDGAYSFPTTEAGSHTLVFTANDGEHDSPTYTVNLTVDPVTNRAPGLADGVAAASDETAWIGSSYSLDLATIFTDPDGDALTYSVSLDGGVPTAAAESYSFTPDGIATHTLVFTANDTEFDSPTYTVDLTIGVVNGTACEPGTGVTLVVDSMLHPNPVNQRVEVRCVLWTDLSDVSKTAGNAFTAAGISMVPDHTGLIVTVNGVTAAYATGIWWSLWSAGAGSDTWGFASVGVGTMPVVVDQVVVWNVVPSTSMGGAPPNLSVAEARSTSDTAAPLLSDWASERIDQASGEVSMFSMEAGSYAYLVVDVGAAIPSLSEVQAGETGDLLVGDNTIELSGLTGNAAKDVWVVAGDPDGNWTTPVKVSLAAGSNTTPELAEGIAAEVNETVPAETPFTVDLSTIFTDADGDTLTYTVAVDGAAAVAADASYSFPTTEAGTHTLVFSANDGAADSPTYTVNLTVEAPGTVALITVPEYAPQATQSSKDAAAWLASSFDVSATTLTSSNVSTAIDVIIGLAAAGYGGDAVDELADFVEGSRETYIRAVGTSGYYDEIARTVLALHIAGRNPLEFPVGDGTTRNLVTELLDGMGSDGSWPGVTVNIDHSWIMIALGRTTAGVPAAAIELLTSRQCLDETSAAYGTWTRTATVCVDYFGTSPDPQPEPTMMAMQALVAAGQGAGDTAYDAAVSAVLSKQHDSGAWAVTSGGTVGGSQVTGFISSALPTSASEAVSKADVFLTSMQLDCEEFGAHDPIIQADIGAVAGTELSYESILAGGLSGSSYYSGTRTATAGALLGWGHRPIVRLTVAGADDNLIDRARCAANQPPVLADGIGDSANYSVYAGQSFSYNLASWFTDADGDVLAYQVSIDGAPAITAPAAYELSTVAAGVHTLVFTASDGIDTSPQFTVNLTVKAIPDYTATTPASYGGSDNATAQYAASWLAANIDVSTMTTTTTNVSYAIDWLIGLASVGYGGDVIDALASFIQNSGTTYIGTVGQSGRYDEIARVVVALQVAGLDPTAYPVSEGATRNLVEELVLGINLDGTWPGSTGVEPHSWAMVALGRTAGGVPDEALNYLLSRQCTTAGDTYFGLWSTNATPCATYTGEHTMVAVQALLAAGLTASDVPLANAIAGLSSIQLDDGGWGAVASSSTSNTEPSGMISSALYAIGTAETIQLATGADDFAISMQLDCDEITYSDVLTEAENGAIAYEPTNYNTLIASGMGSRLSTVRNGTAWALLGLGQHSLVELTAAGADAGVETRDTCPAPVNRPPTLADGVESEIDQTLMATESYEVDLTGVFVDPDKDELTYTVSVDGGEPSVVIDPANYAYVTTAVGDTELVFTATDGEYSVTFTVNLSATAIVNRAPELVVGVGAQTSTAINQGATYSIDLSDIFVDPDGDQLTYAVSVNGAAATAATEAYTLTPSGGGVTQLVFTANDGEFDSPTYTVNLTVSVINGSACAPGAGVTVVVDFTGDPAPQNQRIEVRCADWDDLKDGRLRMYDAFQAAGFVVESESYVETIDGVTADWMSDNRWYTLFTSTVDGTPGGAAATDWTSSNLGIGYGTISLDQAYAFTISPMDYSAPNYGAVDPTVSLASARSTVDVSPPVLSGWTGERHDASSGTVSVFSMEAGTYSYLALEAGATEPTLEQVRAGISDQIGVGANTIDISGLADAGAKDIWVTAGDADGNWSAPIKVELVAYGTTEVEVIGTACAPGTGVTVVVDFSGDPAPENQRIEIRCAGWDELSGGQRRIYDAFEVAGFVFDSASFVEEIDGVQARYVQDGRWYTLFTSTTDGTPNGTASTDWVFAQLGVGATTISVDQVYAYTISPSDAWDGVPPVLTLDEVRATAPVPTNRAPELATGVTSPVTATVTAGDPFTVDLATIFTDPDGDELAYRVNVDGVDVGTVSANYSFPTHAADSYVLTFVANDGQADSPTYTVDLTVQAVPNQAPVLASGITSPATAAVTVGSPFAVDLATIFTDPDGDELTYAVSVNGAAPTAVGAQYTYGAPVAGSFTLVFTAHDGQATSPTYAVNLTVNPTPNQPPTLAGGVTTPVSVTVSAGNAFTVDLTTVFADPDGDELSYFVSVDGAAAVATATSYSYPTSASGSHTLVFHANDTRSDSPVYTVHLTVTDEPSQYRAQTNLAAAWLVAQLDANNDVLPGPVGGTDWGLTMDALFALAAAGVGGDQLAQTAAKLYASGDSYAGAPASLNVVGTAKLIMALELAGLNPAQFPAASGTRNLYTELRGALNTEGTWTNSIAYQQAWVVMALAGTSEGAPAAAVSWLQAQQCLDSSSSNYGTYGFGSVCSGFDQDATAMSIQGLLAAGVPTSDPSIALAVQPLLNLQDDSTGAFTNVYGQANSNTTGLAAQTLRALGQSAAADAGANYVTALQIDCARATDSTNNLVVGDVGTIAFVESGLAEAEQYGIDDVNGDAFRRATVQAIMAYGAAPYGAISATGIAAGVPTRDCTGPANQAPTLASGVTTPTTASVPAGTPFTLDLTTIFADADGDALSYSVSMNGATAIPAAASYSYAPAQGTYQLVFTANDGVANSPNYTVALTVTAPADTTPPNLTPGSGTRISATEADVEFTSDEAGSYRYLVTELGAPTPTAEELRAGGGGVLEVGTNVLAVVNLIGAGAKTVYLVGSDAADNWSNVISIAVGAATPTNPLAPELALVAAIRSASDTAEIEFTSTLAGNYYYLVAAAAAPTPTPDAVKAQGSAETLVSGLNTLVIPNLPDDGPWKVFVAAEGVTRAVTPLSDVLVVNVSAHRLAAPVITGASAARTGADSATVTFTSSAAGEYAVLVRGVGDPAPTRADFAGARIQMGAGVTATSITGLASEAQVIYLLPLSATGTQGEIVAVPLGAYQQRFTITATAGSGGEINPSGAVSVVAGGAVTFQVTAKTNYQVHDVKIDGVSQGAITEYTFTDVQGDHTVDVIFSYVGGLPSTGVFSPAGQTVYALFLVCGALWLLGFAGLRLTSRSAAASHRPKRAC